jgi:epoxyqueuosine reductase
MSFTKQIVAAAKELDFELFGITNVLPPPHFDAFERWLQAGMHGEMSHFVRNFDARKHPEALLPGVQSILMLGVSYAKVLNSESHPIRQLSGIVEYARGVDYHRWIRSRLEKLAEKHHELFPEGRCRITVDTAPILEKQYAAAAGLGTIGKNTLLIHPPPKHSTDGKHYGSKFFIASFLSTEQLEPTPSPVPFEPCGECRRCMDACPTGALCEPFVLDSRRCLNYWTLIHRGELPKDISAKRGSRFLGCDTCQSVCPHNQSIPVVPSGTLDPASLDSDGLRTFLTGTPLEKCALSLPAQK